MAMHALAGQRCSGAEYFWINAMQPRMVMHAIEPVLGGKDLSDFKDPQGKHLFMAFVDTVRQSGNGYVDHQWPKPGPDKPVDKASYVQGFEPWGWVIGSGIYVDATCQQIWSDLSGALAWVMGGIGLAWLLGAYLFVSFHHALTAGLGESRICLRAMSQGDLRCEPIACGSDEAAELMTDLREMRAPLRGMVQRVREASDGIMRWAGTIIDGIVTTSRHVDTLLRVVSQGLREECEGIQQIGRAAHDLDELTQQSAALVEETAAAAAAVRDQADKPDQELGRFQPA